MLGRDRVFASATRVLFLALDVPGVVLRTALTLVVDVMAGEESRTLALQ
jgi:hypothetical protein